jgi:hypothetical protein
MYYWNTLVYTTVIKDIRTYSKLAESICKITMQSISILLTNLATYEYKSLQVYKLSLCMVLKKLSSTGKNIMHDGHYEQIITKVLL